MQADTINVNLTLPDGTLNTISNKYSYRTKINVNVKQIADTTPSANNTMFYTDIGKQISSYEEIPVGTYRYMTDPKDNDRSEPGFVKQ